MAEKHHHLVRHHKEEKKWRHIAGTISYAQTAVVVTTVTKEVKYEKYKEEKHYTQKNYLSQMGVVATGAFVLCEKKYEAKKHIEHVHKHKTKGETSKAVAVHRGGHACHGHHEKKEAKKKDGKSHEKKHHY